MKARPHPRKAPAKAATRPAEPNRPERGNGAEASRLCLIGLKVDSTLRSEIDAYAEAHCITRSRAANHYLAIARETIREREGVPGGRADELLEAVDGLRAAVDILGPPTFGMLRLLAHWSTQGGGVKGKRGRTPRGASHRGRRRVGAGHRRRGTGPARDLRRNRTEGGVLSVLRRGEVPPQPQASGGPDPLHRPSGGGPARRTAA